MAIVNQPHTDDLRDEGPSADRRKRSLLLMSGIAGVLAAIGAGVNHFKNEISRILPKGDPNAPNLLVQLGVTADDRAALVEGPQDFVHTFFGAPSEEAKSVMKKLCERADEATLRLSSTQETTKEQAAQDKILLGLLLCADAKLTGDEAPTCVLLEESIASGLITGDEARQLFGGSNPKTRVAILRPKGTVLANAQMANDRQRQNAITGQTNIATTTPTPHGASESSVQQVSAVKSDQ